MNILISAAPIAGLSSALANPTIAVPVPAGVANGDLRLVIFQYNTGTGPTITPPAGWTLVGRVDNGTDIGIAIYYHVASSDASVNFSFSTASQVIFGQYGLRYADTTNQPVDAIVSAVDASSVSVIAPSLVTNYDNEMVLGFFGAVANATFTPPSGMTEDADGYDGYTTLELARTAQFTKGPTGMKIATASVAGIWVAVMIAVLDSRRISDQLVNDFLRESQTALGVLA